MTNITNITLFLTSKFSRKLTFNINYLLLLTTFNLLLLCKAVKYGR